jgi:predicted ATPase
MGGVLLSLAGKNAALRERANQLAAVAAEQGFPLWRAATYHGWLQVKHGDVTHGIPLLRSGTAAFRATGSEADAPYFIALMARACDIAGQVEEALTLLEDALQIVERTKERWLAAKLNRHKGELLLQ